MHLSEFGIQSQQQRSRGFSELITNITAYQPGSSRHEATVKVAAAATEYHGFLDTDPAVVNQQMSSLKERLDQNAQFDKAQALALLQAHFLCMSIPSSQRDIQHRILSLLMGLARRMLDTTLQPSPVLTSILGEELAPPPVVSEHKEEEEVAEDDLREDGSGSEHWEDPPFSPGSELSAWSDVDADSLKNTPRPSHNPHPFLPFSPADSTAPPTPEQQHPTATTTTTTPTNNSSTIADIETPLQQPEKPREVYKENSLSVWLADRQSNGRPAELLEPSLCFTEPQLIRQVLNVLKGVSAPGNAFFLDETTGKYGVSQGVHMHNVHESTIGVVLQWFADLGSMLRHVQHFCDVMQGNSNAWALLVDPTTVKSGVPDYEQGQHNLDVLRGLPTVSAFAAAVAIQLQEIRHAVLGLDMHAAAALLEAASNPNPTATTGRDGGGNEGGVASSKPLSLLSLQSPASLLSLQASAMCEIIDCCEWRGMPARTVAGLLDGLDAALDTRMMQSTSKGSAIVAEMLLQIFAATVVPYLNILQGWLYHGELDDPANEFFIVRNETIPEDSLAFWSHGYRIRGLSSTSLPAPKFLASYAQEILAGGCCALALTRHSALIATNNNTATEHQYGQQQRYGGSPPAAVQCSTPREGIITGGFGTAGTGGTAGSHTGRSSSGGRSKIRASLAMTHSGVLAAALATYMGRDTPSEQYDDEDDDDDEEEVSMHTMLLTNLAQMLNPDRKIAGDAGLLGVYMTPLRSATPSATSRQASLALDGADYYSSHADLEAWMSETSGADMALQMALSPDAMFGPLQRLPTSVLSMQGELEEGLDALLRGHTSGKTFMSFLDRTRSVSRTSSFSESRRVDVSGGGSGGLGPPLSLADRNGSLSGSFSRRSPFFARANSIGGSTTGGGGGGDYRLNFASMNFTPLNNDSRSSSRALSAYTTPRSMSMAHLRSDSFSEQPLPPLPPSAHHNTINNQGPEAEQHEEEAVFESQAWNEWFTRVENELAGAPVSADPMEDVNRYGAGDLIPVNPHVLSEQTGEVAVTPTRGRRDILYSPANEDLKPELPWDWDAQWGVRPAGYLEMQRLIESGGGGLYGGGGGDGDGGGGSYYNGEWDRDVECENAFPWKVLLQQSLLEPVMHKIEESTGQLHSTMLSAGLPSQLASLQDLYLMNSPALEDFVTTLLNRISTPRGINGVLPFEIDGAFQDALAHAADDLDSKALADAVVSVTAEVLPADSVSLTHSTSSFDSGTTTTTTGGTITRTGSSNSERRQGMPPLPVPPTTAAAAAQQQLATTTYANVASVSCLSRLYLAVQPRWPLTVVVSSDMLRLLGKVSTVVLQMRWVVESLKAARTASWRVRKKAALTGRHAGGRQHIHVNVDGGDSDDSDSEEQQQQSKQEQQKKKDNTTQRTSSSQKQGTTTVSLGFDKDRAMDALQREMLQVTQGLLQHVVLQVMGAGNHLEQDLNKCASLSTMQRSVADYQSHISRWCLLGSDQLSTIFNSSLLRLLDGCLQFCALHMQLRRAEAAISSAYEDGKEPTVAVLGVKERVSMHLEELRKEWLTRRRLLTEVLLEKSHGAGGQSEVAKSLLAVMDVGSYFENEF